MDPYVNARRILILSLAFVFAYFGIDKFIHPAFWQGWIPSWLSGDFGLDALTWLKVIGSIEIATAVLIFQPFRLLRRLGCLLAVLQLIGILTQTGWNDIAVRDIALMAIAIAVWLIA